MSCLLKKQRCQSREEIKWKLISIVVASDAKADTAIEVIEEIEVIEIGTDLREIQIGIGMEREAVEGTTETIAIGEIDPEIGTIAEDQKEMIATLKEMIEKDEGRDQDLVRADTANTPKMIKSIPLKNQDLERTH